MKLEGIHHITAITDDAQRNVDFYAGVIGLRLVKKTVNQDDTDRLPPVLRRRERRPRRRPDLLRVPGRRPGPPGRGDGPPRSSGASPRRRRSTSGRGRLDGRRRGDARGRGPASSPTPRASTTSCRSPNGPTRRWSPPSRDPGRARAAGLPRGARLRARAGAPARRCWRRSAVRAADGESGWEARGKQPRRPLRVRPAPAEPGIQGAGSVHHVAWASTLEEHMQWRREGGRRRRPPDPG